MLYENSDAKPVFLAIWVLVSTLRWLGVATSPKLLEDEASDEEYSSKQSHGIYEKRFCSPLHHTLMSYPAKTCDARLIPVRTNTIRLCVPSTSGCQGCGRVGHSNRPAKSGRSFVTPSNGR